MVYTPLGHGEGGGQAFAYQSSKKPTSCKNGDFEVLREQIQDAIVGCSHPIVEHVESVVVDNGLDIMNIMEMETRDDGQF